MFFLAWQMEWVRSSLPALTYRLQSNNEVQLELDGQWQLQQVDPMGSQPPTVTASTPFSCNHRTTQRACDHLQTINLFTSTCILLGGTQTSFLLKNLVYTTVPVVWGGAATPRFSNFNRHP